MSYYMNIDIILPDFEIPIKYKNHPYTALIQSTSDECEKSIQHLLLAKGQDDTGLVDQRLAHLHHWIGDFDTALIHANNALTMFSNQGDIQNQMYAHAMLANIYVYTDFNKRVYHYEKLKRINRFVKNSVIETQMQYNLSAEYYDEYLFTNEQTYLDEAYRLIKKVELSLNDQPFFYEKIILILLEKKQFKEASHYLSRLDSSLVVSKDYSYQCEYDMLVYACNYKNFRKEKEYTKLVKKTYETSLKENNVYTRTLFLKIY